MAVWTEGPVPSWSCWGTSLLVGKFGEFTTDAKLDKISNQRLSLDSEVVRLGSEGIISSCTSHFSVWLCICHLIFQNCCSVCRNQMFHRSDLVGRTAHVTAQLGRNSYPIATIPLQSQTSSSHATLRGGLCMLYVLGNTFLLGRPRTGLSMIWVSSDRS